MALTPTRYRMQSTLTFLSTSISEMTGELERARGRLQSEDGEKRHQQIEAIRQLEVRRLALIETMRQFDPAIDPAAIVASPGKAT